MRHWRGLTCLWLSVLACGSGTTTTDTPNPELSDELVAQIQEPSPGFVDAPIVSFAARSAGSGSSQVDPNACVLGTPYDISVDEVRALGFDVDADYRLLESEVVANVLVSGEDLSTTKVHLLGRVDHVWRADRTPRAGVALDESTPRGCPPVIGYELTEQMFTDDGSIAGVFPARAGATPLGSAPAFSFYSESDLRNFRGSLPVAMDSSRPFFANARVQMYSAADAEWVFYFQPQVFYQDSKDCIEPLCPGAGGSQKALLSFGVETSSNMAPFADLVGSIAKPSISSLNEFVAAIGPYHPDVRVWIVATSAKSSSVQVRVRIDGGDVQTLPLALTHDPRILTDDSVGGWLDLGALDESVPVEVEVENAADLSVIRSHIVIGGCVVKEADDRCAEPGCVARSAVSVFPVTCSTGD
jgi:hypothetical protein